MTATPPGHSAAQFAATRWSMVLAASQGHSAPAAHRAMGELAQTYWFPLYAYLRRKGHPSSEAEDLVQGFFARVLEKQSLAAVDRVKGKFRSFLLASLNNFVINEWARGSARKRGAGQQILSIDALAAESCYVAEPADTMTPERIFDRRWALATLDAALQRLRNDYLARGQETIFAALEPLLTGGTQANYAAIARRLATTEGAIKVASHRLRRRYRELLREEIAQTLADPALVEEEIRELMAAL